MKLKPSIQNITLPEKLKWNGCK